MQSLQKAAEALNGCGNTLQREAGARASCEVDGFTERSDNACENGGGGCHVIVFSGGFLKSTVKMFDEEADGAQVCVCVCQTLFLRAFHIGFSFQAGELGTL